jgi:hypothetical protein
MISDHILHGDSPALKQHHNVPLEFDYENIERTIDNTIIYPNKRKNLKYLSNNSRIIQDSMKDLTTHNKLSKKKSTKRRKKQKPSKMSSTKKKRSTQRKADKKKRQIKKKS